MVVKYIAGRSGSGKSRLCMEQIAKEQTTGINRIFSDEQQKTINNLIYIIPEQFSLSSERNLAAVSGGGLITAQTLSFQRLAYLVFSETGATGKKTLDDPSKNMLLRKALFELKDSLKFFKSAIDKRGFIDNLSAVVSEFFQYGVCDKLPSAASKVENEGLRLKLLDLHMIFCRYNEYLAANYISTDETLDLLTSKIRDSKLISGAKIWIDGFKSFTPQELKVIEQLMLYADSLTFCLTLNEFQYKYATLNLSDPFYETKDTVNTIYELSEKTAACRGEFFFLKVNWRLKDFPSLAFLEKNYFSQNVAPYCEACENIQIVYADNSFSEIHYVAKKIIGLIRDEHYKYSDIAVVSCAAEDYEKNIRAVFSQYDIPVFIDSKNDILANPLVEFIRAAFAIIASNWQYESVFRLLKTGMTSVSRDKADILENYVLAYGIRRGRWKTPWQYGFNGRYESFDEEELNSLRLQIISFLEPLCGKLTATGRYKASDITRILYTFLINSGVQSVLEFRINEMRSLGKLEIHEQYSRIWDKVMHLLDKTVEILGEETMSVSEYAKILDAGFSGTKMELAPPTLDYCIAGDLRRTRLPEIKALFVLGANEGLLPEKRSGSGIFSDLERTEISGKSDLPLAPSNLFKAYEEQFLIYQAVTKPSRYLSISCFLSGTDGKESHPSLTLDTISELLPTAGQLVLNKLPKQSLFELDIQTAKPSFGAFASLLGEFSESDMIGDLFKDAAAYYMQNDKYAKKIEQITLTLNSEKTEILNSRSVSLLYPGVIKTSVSKLEKYARCPFSYFVQYNLKADERKIYEVQNVDLGNIFHTALEKFSDYLNKENLSWNKIENQKLKELTDKSLNETFNNNENEIFQSSSRYKHFAERVKEISHKSIWALTEHMKSGSFELAFTEAVFDGGGPESGGLHLGTIQVPLENGTLMLLEGRIDRIDLMNKENEQFVKIIDYKSGNTAFSFAEVFYGLQLQLLIYMDAFIKKYKNLAEKDSQNLKINPAAVFYFRLTNPTVDYGKKSTPDELETELLKKFKMSGVVSSDQTVINALDEDSSKSSDIFSISSSTVSAEGFNKVLEYSIKKAEDIGNEILKGNIAAAPYRYKKQSGCTFCQYKSACKFEPMQNATQYRNMKSLTTKEAKERVTGES